MSKFVTAFKNSLTGRVIYTLALDISNYWTILGVIVLAFIYGREVGRGYNPTYLYLPLYLGWVISIFTARVATDSALEEERSTIAANRKELYESKLELQHAFDKANLKVAELERIIAARST